MLPPVVIDVGSYSLKVGLAGDENGPRIIRNWMGKPKDDGNENEDEKKNNNTTKEDTNNTNNENNNDDNDVTTGTLNGDNTESSDAKSTFKKPSIKIMVNNKNIKTLGGIDFSHFIFGNRVLPKLHDLNIYSFYDKSNLNEYNESYFQGLQLFYKNEIFHELLSNMDDIGYDALQNANVLLTQQPFCSNKWKKRMNEIMFETINVNGLNYQYSGVLSMYATNRLNGVTLDVGYNNSSVIPIIDGYPLENCINKINLGGRHVDQYLQILLRKCGITLHTDFEMERIRELKEKLCEFHLDGSFIRSNKDDEEFNVIRYQLPDKKILQIGSARVRAPEVLYSPHLIGHETNGINELFLSSIKKCDVHTRKFLLSNVLMTGATTKLKNFGQRFLNEVKRIDDNDFFDYKNVLSLRYADEWNFNNGKNDPTSTSSTTTGGRLSRAKRRSRALDEARKSLTFSTPDSSSKNDNSNNTADLDNFEDRIKRTDWKKTKIRLISLAKRDISAWIGGSLLCSMDEVNNKDSVFWNKRDDYLNERRNKDPNFKEPSTPRELNQLTDDFADELLGDIEFDD